MSGGIQEKDTSNSTSAASPTIRKRHVDINDNDSNGEVIRNKNNDNNSNKKGNNITDADDITPVINFIKSALMAKKNGSGKS